MNFENLLFIPLIFFLFYFIFSKYKILSDNISYSNHKKIGIKNNTPIILGGLYILAVVLIFFPNNTQEAKIIFFLITILGLMSDKNILPNPTVRFVFQLTLILNLVYFENLRINDIRIDFLNNILEYKLFNIFFTVFCLAILVNGSNFIDGLNGLLVGYCSIIILSILFLSLTFEEIEIVNKDFLEVLLLTFLIFFIFNIFGKVYLGDGGSYLAAILIGSYLIKFYDSNENLSPFYIALILWYPSFENLFSLIRRIIKKKNVSDPDNRHLHQLVFLFFKSRFKFNLGNFNSLSALVILLFNIPGFIVATFNSSQSSILIITISINIAVYLFFYYFFVKYLKLNK